MAPFDETALRRSLEASERRLALSRQRKRQQKKGFWVSVAVILFVVPLLTAGFVARKSVPAAPLLVVTWPKNAQRQVVASGASLLPREGQPFQVEILGGEAWEISWQGDVESHALSIPWSPMGKNAVLRAKLKNNPGDWTRFFGFLQPAREVSLFAATAAKDGEFGRVLEAREGGVWISPQILAAGSVGWDARALPLLDDAAKNLPQTAASSVAEGEGRPTAARWILVGDFEGRADKPAPDGATFAALQSEQIESDLPNVARGIARKLPKDSVKFVLRLDKTPPQGVLRLAFDGKAARRAWIRRAGESASGPFEGWEKGEAPGNLAPSLPRE